MAFHGNALTRATDKVNAEIEAISAKLTAVDDAYDYGRSRWVNETWVRQGARSLEREVTGAYVWSPDTFGLSHAALTRIAEAWNSREDWRAAADKARVLRRVEKLVGLG